MPGSPHLINAVLNPFSRKVTRINQTEARPLHLLHLSLIGSQFPLKGLVLLNLVLKVCGVPVALISCNLYETECYCICNLVIHSA